MDRRIKFRHLEAFIAIARAKSLKRAAGQLNLTQPTISKTLKELETILKVSLMDRGRAGVRLTAEGEVFLQFAEQSMSALQSGLTSIAGIGAGAGALLTIGALPSVAAGILPDAVLRFRGQSPATVVRVLEGPHDDLTDRLRSGALDLVVGRLGRPQTMAGLAFTQLYSEQVVVVVAPDHPLVGVTQLDQLRGFPVLYPPPGAAIRPLVARQMIATGMPLFGDRIECASGAFGRAMTLGPSRAIWFISRGVVADDLDHRRLVSLDIDLRATAGPVGIMARAEEVPGPLVHLFRQSLRETVAHSATDSAP